MVPCCLSLHSDEAYKVLKEQIYFQDKDGAMHAMTFHCNYSGVCMSQV